MQTSSTPSTTRRADPFAIARTQPTSSPRRTGVEKHDIALTLGSGWAKAADLIGETIATVPATEIIGFSAPALTGHVGTLRSVLLPNGKRALVIGARTHFYEGHGVRRVVHSVRTAAAAGATTMILTNGAGGIKEHWTPGTPVLISDHINLTAASPLEGATFIDLTDLYSRRLRDIARSVAARPRRGRVRAVPRPALRDPGRGADGEDHRRPHRRHVDRARGDRRTRGRHGDPRVLAHHQPRRRHLARAAEPRRGAAGRPRRRAGDQRPARARSWRPSDGATGRRSLVDGSRPRLGGAGPGCGDPRRARGAAGRAPTPATPMPRAELGDALRRPPRVRHRRASAASWAPVPCA